MEEETKRGRGSNKSLPEFRGNNPPHNVFHVGACVGIVILPELGRSHLGKAT